MVERNFVVSNFLIKTQIIVKLKNKNEHFLILQTIKKQKL